MPHGPARTCFCAAACRLVICWLVICGVGLSAGGCVVGPILGLILNKRSDTVEVPAEYELSAGNLLILVDNKLDAAQSSGVRSLLSRQLAREIKSHSLAPTLIPADELASYRTSRAGFEQLDISQIGQDLSAGHVLYVEITEFRLGTLVDNPAGQGVIRTRVKVFDVQENRRAWPEAQPLGREVSVRTGFREPDTEDYRQDFTEKLCDEMAVSIVKLFREHSEPRQAGAGPVEEF